MNFKSLNIKTFKNLSVYGLGQFINIISPLLITPYIILVCGLEKFGIVSIGQSFAFILIVIVDYSSYIKGVKDISINRNNKGMLQEILTTIYFSKFILLLIVISISTLVIYFIPFFWDENKVFFFSIAIVVGQFLNPTWFFQGRENFKWITLINIFSKVIYVLGVLIFVNSSDDYYLVNFFFGFGLGFSGLIALFSNRRIMKFNKKDLDINRVKKYLESDFSFCISQLFLATRNYSSVIIIGFISGDLNAGQFKVIEQITNFFRTYLQMFFKFSLSYVCFEIDKNIQQGIVLWKKYNLINLLVLTVMLVTVFLFTKEVLFFFKVKSDINLMSLYLKTALLIPFLIGITLPLEQLLFSLDMNKEYVKTTLFITFFNVVLLVIVLTFSNLFNVFLVLIFVEICLLVIYWILLKNYLKIKQ